MVHELSQAARELHKLGPKYVLIKGGHLIPPPPSDPNHPSPPLSDPNTPSPQPSDPNTPSPAAHNSSADAATSTTSSAPQTSQEDTAAAQDSAESGTTTCSADVSQAADASVLETHEQGTNGHEGTQPDRQSGAVEQARNQSNGNQAPTFITAEYIPF